MATIHVDHAFFTCRRSEEMAVLRINEGAKKLLTTVAEKEALISVLETIQETSGVKGVAVIYSDNYDGGPEYRQLLSESLRIGPFLPEKRAITFQSAIIQLLEIIYGYPLPIVGGVNGDIGPDSFGLNLAFDLRIATDSAKICNPNLELGFPPSSILTFYLVQSLGSPLATELMFTKSELEAKQLLDLRLISEIAAAEDLESTCLQKLRMLAGIPRHAIVEARRKLQPDINDIANYLNSGFKGGLRSVHKLRS